MTGKSFFFKKNPNVGSSAIMSEKIACLHDISEDSEEALKVFVSPRK